ncbi:MAG: Hsp20/alpha crystallin family protein [Verrucomicrobiales bacterium]|nr:Hsp20/alpha crystallin family protein [Verrucomicrobiales bacterium]
MAEIRWQFLQGQIGDLAYELRRVQLSQFAPIQQWYPAINAFRCRGGIAICVDLAGVDKSQIDLQVEPRRLLIRGNRPDPAPDRSQYQEVQVLAMEINWGAFEREVELPAAVEPARASAEQHNGMLWIHLPLRAQSEDER